ncbi:MAG: zinc-binding dehydrogenase, partial [Candidatus Methylomirabilis sp.]|nr:zinc-binding dehydrogenase [Deltaproteobacteria bacterium]
AVLRRVPAEGSKALVIGGGMIGYAVIAALRMLGVRCEIAHATQLDYQSEMGLALGADEPILGGGGAFEERVGELTGAKRYKPKLGKAVFKGGFDHVYDCIGSVQSLSDAIRVCRERGALILVGAAGVLREIDWTPVWTNEVDLLGVVGYGVENFRGERVKTFDLVIDKLRGTALPVQKLVTHAFPLTDYREAIRANLDRAGARSIKTIFEYPRA